MEKRIKPIDLEGEGGLKKIVVTGPESTGKTMLSEALSNSLNALLLPELARGYIEGLKRPYTYADLELIARQQVQQEARLTESAGSGILVMDTWLIITKVWFDVVYGKIPEWVNEYISSSKIDLFLVCKPDLPWIPDSVRENGGEMRLRLFDRYCCEIENQGFKYEIVEGIGEARLHNALHLLKSHHIR